MLTWAGLGALLIVCTVVGATAVQELYADRQYRRLLAAGDQALAAGNTYSAVEAFSGALAFRPDSMVAYLRRGQAYREQKRYDEAERDWHQASRLSPEAPQPLVALGDHLDDLGRPGEAAEWYGQAAVRLGNADTDLLYRLALARFKAGSSAGAIDPLKSVVAQDPTSADAHYLLGLVRRDAGDMAGAITALEAAVSLAPDSIPVREELAEVYAQTGRGVDEMTQLHALASRDKDVGRQLMIAKAEARGGQLAGALGTLRTALEAHPNDSRVLLAIGRVYIARAERNGGDLDSVTRAIEVIERALGGTAPRSEGLALYGRALYLSGDVESAERLLRDAVATSPVETEAFGYLADAAERLGHDVVARDALLNLDALQGDTVTAALRATRAARIGELSLRAGEPVLAADYLTRAIKLGHENALTLGHLAHARWLTGDAAGARELLAKALSADPRDPQLQRIARTVR